MLHNEQWISILDKKNAPPKELMNRGVSIDVIARCINGEVFNAWYHFEKKKWFDADSLQEIPVTEFKYQS